MTSRRRPPVWPAHLERQLAARLRRRARVVRSLVREQLHALPRLDAQRTDSVFGARALGPRLRLAVRQSLPITPASLEPTARGIDATVTAAVVRELSEQAGADLAALTEAGSGATAAAVRAWTGETAIRVAEFEDAAIDRAVKAAAEAADQGEDPEAAARAALESIETRAALLARDAVGDLVAEVTRARATQLGSGSYIWRSQEDAAVRPLHRELDGDVRLWDDPHPTEGHPGDAYACRCWAEPIAGALVKPRPRAMPAPPPVVVLPPVVPPVVVPPPVVVAPEPVVPEPEALPEPESKVAPDPLDLSGVGELTLFDGLDDAQRAAAMHRIFGRDVLPHEIATWAGLTQEDLGAGTMLTMEIVDGQVSLVAVTERFELEREYGRRAGEGLFAHHELFVVSEAYRSKGLGAEVFERQVLALREAGFGYIETLAAGDANSGRFNGYYTWARFGFDGPLKQAVMSSLPPGLQGAHTVQDLMATTAGREWWKANGGWVDLEFGLHENSLSLEVFEAYLREIAARPPRQDRADTFEARVARKKARFEQIDLSADQEAALERVWAARTRA